MDQQTTHHDFVSAFTVVLIAISIALSYGAALNAYFVADDFTLIAGIVHNADDSPRWSLALTHWISGQHFESFRPLVTLVQLTIYSLAGAQPIAFRLINFTTHALIALQVFRLTSRVTSDSRAGILAALLFATNPLIVEGVSYVGSLGTLLCALFMLSTLVAAADYIRHGRPINLGAVLLLTFLSFASKEEAFGLLLSAGVVCSMFAFEPRARFQLRRALAVYLGIVVVTAFYLVHKRAIFGHFFPNYFGEINDFSGSIVGLLNVWRRFFDPVNYLVDDEAVRLALVYQVLMVGIVLVGAFVLKTRWRTMLFAAVLFVTLAAPVARFFYLGFDPGLTNGRLVYSAAAASAMFIAVICATRSIWRLQTVPFIAGLALLLLQVYVTSYNNRAWIEAGAVMKKIQTESLQMTGQDVTAPVYNVPDIYKGVFIDRGGWAYARFSPFVKYNRYGKRTRIIQVRNQSPEPISLSLAAPQEGLAIDGIEREIEPNETRVIVITFNPSRQEILQAELVAAVETRKCLGAVTIARIGGAATAVDRSDVYLAADIRTVKERLVSPGGYEVVLGVAAPQNGIAPDRLTISLAPGSPWLSTVELVDQESAVALGPTIPFAAGGQKMVRIIMTPTGDPPWPRVRLAIEGLNAPKIKALDPDLLVEVDPSASFPKAPRRRGYSEIVNEIAVDPDCAASEKTIDFGYIPLLPPDLKTGDPFTSWVQSNSEPLFWDDIGGRVRRLAEVDGEPTVFDLGGDQLARLEHRMPTTRELLIEPGELAYWDQSAPRSFTIEGVNTGPDEVSWLAIEMRAMFATTFYGLVAWGTSPDTTEAGYRAFLSLPDGRWRTYFIRLDDLRLPSASLIRWLRVTPVISGGYVELRRIRLLSHARQP